MKKKIIKLIRATHFLDAKTIELTQIVFEKRVLLKCFQCTRYGINWSCPPKIPDMDYQKLISEYDDLVLAYCRMPFTKEQFEIVRRKSSTLLHRTLLDAEKLLWDNNYPLAISFIGGSCKLCSEGCDQLACRRPNLARIPIEAAGVNVVKSAENVGLSIIFPPENYLYRVGLLGW